MTKHKPILTDAEMHTLICGNLLPVGLSLDRLESFARNVEQYVLKKLAEQEPAFYSYAGGVYAADSMDMCDYTREYGTPLYAHPMPNGQVNLGNSNHIPEAVKMAVPDGWQLVPKTPTHNMVDNAHNCDSYFEAQDIYKAMLAAAPKFGEEERAC